ncbi:ribonuclease HI [filamentous cyanobacterium Phorm 46]|nr:ribonuclease HI [filamentous cyanobacterium Phorm 46]
MSNLKQVSIYTRGITTASGAGGYGAILLYQNHRKELSGGFQLTTNNRMDILAAIAGLKALQTRCKVTVYNNNGYLVDAIANNWALRWQANNWKNSDKQPTANVDLWEQLLQLCSQHDVEFIRIKQYAGHQEYECCNYISRQAAHQQNLPVDEGYQPRFPLGKP